MRNRSASTDHKRQEGPEPHTALRALARLLGRQAVCQLPTEKGMQDLALPVDQDRNASRSSDTTTKPA